MKKRILSLLLLAAMLVGVFPVAATYATESTDAISLWYAGQAAENVALPHGGCVHLDAQVRSDLVGALQWQIAVGGDEWVDIQNASSASLRVSYGMVASVLSADNSARVRCVLTVGEDSYASRAATIYVTDETTDTRTDAATPEAPDPLPAPEGVVTETVAETTPVAEEPAAEELAVDTPVALALGEDDVMPLSDEDDEAEPQGTPMGMASGKTYTITIRYVYADSSEFSGYNVALPYIEQRPENWEGTVTVTSPNCIGYSPDTDVFSEYIGPLSEDKVYTVYYSPAEVSYSVRHYQQNVDNDEYTLVETTRVSGYTEAMTSDAAAQSYAGFTALSHYSDKIAADGSTAVDIYYDRNYYMISFDLAGGYGTEPIYARYGAAIGVNEPTRAGYHFAGWSPVLPTTMPVGGGSYTAQWTANDGVNFVVVYWLEDANEAGTYHYWTAATQTAPPGSVKNATAYSDYTKYLDTTAQNAMGTYEKRYTTYNADKTAQAGDVTIAGDGSTVLNVYYDRKEYTLKFYYAANDNGTYKVVGGSTWPFGLNNDYGVNNATVDEQMLLRYMYSNRSTDWGEITAAPALNERGKARNYTSGSDTVDNVEFLYISFKAKYGADISELWPCDVFDAATRSKANGTNSTWTGTAAYVSAWNGEHHVWYTQSQGVNGNQTIKGNYSELDYVLLFDSKFEDSDTVCYLCFWENGADIGWSVPELYRYRVWLPQTNGEVPEGKDTTTNYNGVDYYLSEQYDTCDDSSWDKQTAPAINGYTLKERNGYAIDNPDASRYSEAWQVDFYYKANTYTLTFINGDTQLGQTSMSYGQKVWSYYADKIQSDLVYYDPNLRDIYTFDGWYTAPSFIEGTQFDLNESTTMPSNNGTLYAHWVPVTRTVEVYKTEACAKADKIGETITVSNNTVVPEGSRPADPTNGDNEFIGWFYTDAAGAEHAFSFASTPVTQDLQVYAKWRSTETRMISVRYVLADGTEVAKTETQRLTVGQVRTYNAKTGSALYPVYQQGCFPTLASQSITPTGEDGEELVVTFEYVQYDAVPYEVQFVIEDESGNRHPAYRVTDDGVEFAPIWDKSYVEYIEKHDNNDKSVVTELYVPEAFSEAGKTLPTGYVPNALQTTLVVVPGENSAYNAANTILFVYKYKEGVARYSVEYYIQNSNDDEYTLYQHTEGEGATGSTVSAQPIKISGYEYSHEMTERNKGGNTLTSVDGVDTISGTIVVDHSLTLKLYYDAIEYPYQIMYLEKDTGVVLAPTKTESAAGVPLKARYGKTVAADAIDIEHYKVDAATKSIVIEQEATNDDGSYTASQNTIYFYYTPISGGLEISKAVELDPTQAAEAGIDKLPDSAYTQEFTFTITAAQGFHKSSYDYIITKTDTSKESGTVLVRDGALTVTLHHGESIRIPELRLDTYTVTESYVSGFRTTVQEDGVKTIQQSASVILDVEGETETVAFVNQYPFYTGELVVRKDARKEDASDPDATGYYKVTVTLWPDQAAREKNRVITWQNAAGAPADAPTSLTVPAWVEGGENQEEFSVAVYVPVVGENGALGEVKMTGVPTGNVRVEEQAKTMGYITDYYRVAYDKAEHKNDEVKDRGAVVDTHVHGGHPTAVTFINTYKKGSLTIEKTVTQEYANDSFQSGKFYFTVTGTTELPDGRYALDDTHTAVVAGGNVSIEGEIAIEITRGESGTSWSDSVTLDKLPAGYYTVTEAAATGYTCQSDNPSQTVLVSDGTSKVSFENRFDRTTGSLQVSKTIQLVKTEGVTIDTTKDFTFTLTLTDGTLAGSYAYSKNNGTAGTLTVGDNGALTFTLRHDQTITIDGLPVGVYELREQTEVDYASNFEPEPEDGDHTKTRVVVETGKTASVACINRYPVDSATLIVSKTVVTPAGRSTIDQAPADDGFTFTVSLSGFNSKIVSLSEFISVSFYDAQGHALASPPTPIISQDGQNGTITFNLHHGEYASMHLPVCQFTVSETALVRTVGNTAATLATEYETAYTVAGAAGTDGTSYALQAGQEVTAAFTNTYKRHYVDLTIETTTALAEQNFIFDVKSADGGNIALSVVLVGTDSITVRDLPVGKYVVTEQNDWSWRESALTSQTVTPANKGTTGYGDAVTLDDANVTVAFDYGAVDRTEWLSGYSYGVKGGG